MNLDFNLCCAGIATAASDTTFVANMANISA
jgi:hypothetical protein